MTISIETAELPRNEPCSPFVASRGATGPSLEDLVRAQQAEPPLVVELVSQPRAIVARLVDARSTERVVSTSLLVVAVATAAFSGAMLSHYGLSAVLRGAGLSAFSVLLGLAAALGPIYGTSVVLGVRLPLGHLVAVLVASSAAGGL